MILVTCPCCKGEKMLQLFEEDLVTHTLVMCCHCGNTGTVEAEVQDSTRLPVIPQGWLQRMMGWMS